MNDQLRQLHADLYQVAQQIITSFPSDEPYSSQFGINGLHLTKHEIAEKPRYLAERIAAVNTAEYEIKEAEKIIELNLISSKLNYISTTYVPHFINGHGHIAIPAAIQIFDYISEKLDRIIGPDKKLIQLDWDALDSDAVPDVIQQRANDLKSRLGILKTEIDSISPKIEIINGAYRSAQALPENMQSLQTRKQEIEEIAAQANQILNDYKNQLIKKMTDIEVKSDQITTHSENIDKLKKEAEAAVTKCGEFQSIATSIGLSAAFHAREKNLNYSMYFWFVILVVGLSAMGAVGFDRAKSLTNLLDNNEIDWMKVSVNMYITLLYMGAPFWLAWLSSKQIGQRFKLSEDYAYKAAVSKAYEGYRKEASLLDEDFQKRLFNNALTRLDESPLRHMDKANHASPFSEFSSSAAAKELSKGFIDVLKKVAENLPNINKESSKHPEKTEPHKKTDQEKEITQ